MSIELADIHDEMSDMRNRLQHKVNDSQLDELTNAVHDLPTYDTLGRMCSDKASAWQLQALDDKVTSVEAAMGEKVDSANLTEQLVLIFLTHLMEN